MFTFPRKTSYMLSKWTGFLQFIFLYHNILYKLVIYISIRTFQNKFFYLMQGIIYFALTLGLEVLLPHRIKFLTASNLWMSLKEKLYAPSSSSLEPLLKSLPGDNGDLEEDIDVQTERNRVLSGGAGSAIVYLRNLRKVLKHITIFWHFGLTLI